MLTKKRVFRVCIAMVALVSMIAVNAFAASIVSTSISSKTSSTSPYTSTANSQAYVKGYNRTNDQQSLCKQDVFYLDYYGNSGSCYYTSLPGYGAYGTVQTITGYTSPKGSSSCYATRITFLQGWVDYAYGEVTTSY